jgi:hypothetical protein
LNVGDCSIAASRVHTAKLVVKYVKDNQQYCKQLSLNLRRFAAAATTTTTTKKQLHHLDNQEVGNPPL